MTVPTSIDQLSTTAASNSPSGSDSPSVLDDHLRAQGAFIAQLRDERASVVLRPIAGDNGPQINGAIAALVVAGGGVLDLKAGAFSHSTSIVLASNIALRLNGATLQWTGGATSQVTCPASGVVTNAEISGGTINGGSTATKVLELRSAYRCAFKNLTLQSNSATSIALDLLCNSSGGTNPDGNRNTVFNQFENVLQEGICGTQVRLKGNGASTGVVTLNSFVGFNGRGAMVRGVDFASWCDSNYFAGMTRIQVSGNNGVGTEWNTDNPNTGAGVYANNFDHLAIDAFGSATGRIGAKLNCCAQIDIGFLFTDPACDGGQLVVSPFCYSHDILHAIGGGNRVDRKILGGGIAVGGSASSAYSVFTSSFATSGASQASARFADTFNTDATGAYGLTVDNRTAAGSWTLGTYTGINLADISKGAGSTVNYSIGLALPDRSSGANNWGIHSQISAGAGKYFINATGSAASYFGGWLRAASLSVGTDSIPAYSLLTASSALAGSFPASAKFGETFNTDATGASGVVISNATKAASWTLDSYYALNIADLTKGAGSAVNYNIGAFFTDRSAGANNWGIFSQISAGAGKYFINAPGTAQSFLGGALTFCPAQSAAPAVNGALTFELTNDTTLKIKVKGSDGVVRSATITLA